MLKRQTRADSIHIRRFNTKIHKTWTWSDHMLLNFLQHIARVQSQTK